MNILLLDLYPTVPYRTSKCTSGGFGTGNDLGSGIGISILKYLVKKGIHWPPVYALQCMAILKSQNHNVVYKSHLNFKDVDECDCVLVVSSIISFDTDISAIERIRVRGQKPIIVIGPFAAVCPEPYTSRTCKVVVPEPDLYFFSNSIETTVACDDYLINPRLPEVSLDKLPYPDWANAIEGKHVKYMFEPRSRIAIPILATRGCPYSCYHYCTYPTQQGRKIRARTPANVVAEMQYWSERLGVRSFIFRDPVFSINRRHTVELCERMIQTGISFRFIVETHLRNLDVDLVRLLHRAGLRVAYVGVESSVTSVLEQMNRATVPQSDQIRKIKELENNGVLVQQMYIFGSPGDTEETIAESIAFSKKIGSMYAHYSVFTPYPGTPIFNDYKDRITTESFSAFNQWNLVFKHPKLTNKKVRALIESAYRQYYFSPKWMARYCRYWLREAFG